MGVAVEAEGVERMVVFIGRLEADTARALVATLRTSMLLRSSSKKRDGCHNLG